MIKLNNLNFIQYKPVFKAQDVVSNPDEKREIPKEILVLLEKVKNAESYQQYWDILQKYAALPDVTAISNDTLKNKSFYIKFAAGVDIDYLKTILQGLEKKQICIAPKFVASALSKEGFGIAVLKIDGTNSGELIPLSQGYHLLEQKSKKSAYSDINKIIKLGIANAKILDKSGLKITPDKPHRLVCENWQNLYPINNYSKSEINEIIKKLHNIIFNPDKF